MEPELKKSNKKIVIIVAAIVAAIALAVGIGVIVYSGSPARRLQEQLDLGARYLSELDYEQAIAAYEAALEIDPNSVEAYIGLLGAYAGNGDADKISRTREAAKVQLNDDDILRVEKGIIENSKERIEAYVDRQEYHAAVQMLEALNTAGFTGDAGDEIIKMTLRVEGNYLDAVIDGTLPTESWQEMPGDAAPESLQEFLSHFMMAAIGDTFDRRNLSAGFHPIEEILSPYPAVDLTVYPAYFMEEYGGYGNPPAIPDPKGLFSESGYQKYAAENIDWVLAHVFHCTPGDIEQLRKTAEDGEPAFRYYDNGYYYTVHGAIGWMLEDFQIHRIRYDGEFYDIVFSYTSYYAPYFRRAVVQQEQADGQTYWSISYLGEWIPEDSDAERLMDRMRYREFLITSEMSGENFESFALTDLDRDGREELVTLGGGAINYTRIWMCREEKVEEAWFTTGMTVYDNGIVRTGFNSGAGYYSDTYYRVQSGLQFELVEQITHWLTDDTISIGEESYEEDAPRVSKEVADRRTEEIIGVANELPITFYENTYENQDLLLRDAEL